MMGSSPLTRGALVNFTGTPYRSGLIPAHAGSTITPTALAGSRRAHPRSRGEHENHMRRTAIKRGSSPLTRGAPVPVTRARGGLGLIPAHAGSTVSCEGA